jgi:hypothetical protein
MPIKRRHVWTGRKTGAPIGNANARRHGLKAADSIIRRKQVNDVLRAAREAIRSASGGYHGGTR